MIFRSFVKTHSSDDGPFKIMECSLADQLNTKVFCLVRLIRDDWQLRLEVRLD